MIFRAIYVALIVLYSCAIVLWCKRDSIAYKAVRVQPGLLEKRSLTPEEYDAYQRVPKVARKITMIFLCISILFCVLSVVFIKMHWFEPVLVVKICVVVSFLFALLIFIGNGISFIGESPIR